MPSARSWYRLILVSVLVFGAATGPATATVPGLAAASMPAAGPSTRGARTLPLITVRAREASRYAHGQGMNAGVAVMDTRTGRVYVAGYAHRRFASASVVKTLIATRLLLTGQMHGATAALARSMIERSDNDAATALYPKVGGDHLVRWIDEHYHLRGLGARPTMPGLWGSTQLTAAGMVRFYNAVRHDPLVWPWLSRTMHAYAQTSAAGEPNAFGIAAVAPRSAVKNGWDVDRDVRHPSNAIINTTGFVQDDRYAVAILAEGPGRLYYSAGERIVTDAARRLIRLGRL